MVSTKKWHTPQIKLFAQKRQESLDTGLSEPIVGGSKGLCLFPAPLIANVVNKILDYNCLRIIVIAPGWPNMSWFWDIVCLSSQIPLCLPNQANFLTRPFNRSLHENLLNLNLHAWLLDKADKGGNSPIEISKDENLT